MKDRCRKFTPLARQSFEEALQKLHADVSSVQRSPMGLRSILYKFFHSGCTFFIHLFFFIWKKCSFLKPWKNRAINYNEEKFSTIFHNMVSTNEVRLISWRGISTPRSYVRLISKRSRKISWIRTTSLLSQKGAFYSIWVDQMLRVDRVKKSFSVKSYFPEFSAIYLHERFNW